MNLLNVVNKTEAMTGIYNAFKEWESQSCLKFVLRTSEPDYIEFFGSGGGYVESMIYNCDPY